MIKAGIFPPFTSARNRATIATTKTKKIGEKKEAVAPLVSLPKRLQTAEDFVIFSIANKPAFIVEIDVRKHIFYPLPLFRGSVLMS